jgi:hypothetical protein
MPNSAASLTCFWRIGWSEGRQENCAENAPWLLSSLIAMPKYSEVVTLHRYYIWANKFRTCFERALGTSGAPELKDVLVWFADEPGMFLSYWYAALYVVIEGWKELGFQDEEIDALLNSPNVDHLRRYRNGVCHFQREYLDSRFQEIMTSPESVSWVRNLNRALGRFFLQTAKSSGISAARLDEPNRK